MCDRFVIQMFEWESWHHDVKVSWNLAYFDRTPFWAPWGKLSAPAVSHFHSQNSISETLSH